VIYQVIKRVLLFLIQGPAAPPPPPAGSPESIQIFRASKKYLLYNLVCVAIVFLILFLLTGALAFAVCLDPKIEVEGKIASLIPAVLVILGGLFAYFLTRLEYDMRYYVVTDRSLRIREGVMEITEVTLTYANVQHLEIQQGPIQQMLGIADVVVRTAGGGGEAPSSSVVAHLLLGGLAGAAVAAQGTSQNKGHRGVMRGIENATEIRDQINALLKRYRDAGLGDPEDRHKATRKSGQWHPLAIQRLKEIRQELRALRQGTTLWPDAFPAKPGSPPTTEFFGKKGD